MHRLAGEFGDRVAIEWRAYLLRPQPRAGPKSAQSLERFREYTRSWLRPAGDAEAGSFRVWQTNEGPPSHSIPAHLVAKAAATLGSAAFRTMHERLLRAYFAENRDISDSHTLLELWRELGFSDSAFERREDPALLRRVLAEHREALDHGATGVPAVRLAGQGGAIVGAHPYQLYHRWAERALSAD